MSEGKHIGSYEKHVCNAIGGQDKHICQLAQKVAFGEIKELVDYPNFICENCDRVVKSAKDLCKPKSLRNIPYHE